MRRWFINLSFFKKALIHIIVLPCIIGAVLALLEYAKISNEDIETAVYIGYGIIELILIIWSIQSIFVKKRMREEAEDSDIMGSIGNAVSDAVSSAYGARAGIVVGSLWNSAVGFIQRMNREEEKSPWILWMEDVAQDSAAAFGYFKIKRKFFSKNCIITGIVVNADKAVIASEAWETPYDGELDELSKSVFDLKAIREEAAAKAAVAKNVEAPQQLEAPAAEGETVEERLARVKKLYDSGILDEEEYKAKKKEIMELV